MTVSNESAGANPLVGSWWLPPVEQLRSGLDRWVSSRLGDKVSVQDATFPTDGHSSVNVVFDLAGAGWDGRYVARCSPPETAFPMFPTTDLVFQKACMDTIRSHSAVPVPEVVWHEPEQEWLGQPFIVMRWAAGETWPTNPPYQNQGWVLDADPESRRAMQDAAVRALADLHTIDEQSADLGFLEQPSLGTKGTCYCVEYSRWYYEWAREGIAYPLLERAIQWLDDHQPALNSLNVMNWGDARPGNILFANNRVSAVLDWEMASLGPREVDLGFLILFHRYFDLRSRAAGYPGMPELFRTEDVVDTYLRAGGQPVGDLTWFQMFAAVRISIHHVRQIARAVAFGRIERPTDTSTLLVASPLLMEFLATTPDS